MDNINHPVLQCFRGDSYPLSLLADYGFINGMERGMLKFAKLRLGDLDLRNLENIPFFGSDCPQVLAPFSIVKNAGFLEHFYEFRMFKIMDALYYPMRMKVLQQHTLDLTLPAQLRHWERLGGCMNKKCETSVEDKEMTAVFAVSQSLRNIKRYLDGAKLKPDEREKLSKEYEKISTEFAKQMDGVPEYYYFDVLVDYPRLCAHSDGDFEKKSVDFILDTINCFDIENRTNTVGIISEAEKNERILGLAELANRALFFNPFMSKEAHLKMFDLASDFPKRVKRAYHKREKERAAEQKRDEGRGRK